MGDGYGEECLDTTWTDVSGVWAFSGDSLSIPPDGLKNKRSGQK